MPQTKGGVIIIGTCMLDEEQGRRHGNLLGLESDDVAVKEGLQVIIAMVFQILLRKDSVNIGQGLEPTTTGLIVYHPNLIVAIGGSDAVKTVDLTTECCGLCASV